MLKCKVTPDEQVMLHVISVQELPFPIFSELILVSLILIQVSKYLCQYRCLYIYLGTGKYQYIYIHILSLYMHM